MVSDERVDEIGDFKPGSIQMIKLENFLTYQDVEMIMGPRLNIVVGANGTGKSTILNALCLGLGGDPKMLGRSDDLREFVMHGQDKAKIEITLTPKDGEDPVVIERVIDRNKGSEKGRGKGASTCWINGEKVCAKSVQEYVKQHFSIAVDNLCMFLPQDKVGSFSQITPQDLLIETEKSVSSVADNDYLYKMHQELIQDEARLMAGAVDVEHSKTRLKKLKHENEQLERAKELLEERENAMKQAERLNQKKMWMEFDAAREQALELQKERETIKATLTQATLELRPLEEAHTDLERKKKQVEATCKRLSVASTELEKKMDTQIKKFDNHDEAIETLIADLAEIDSKRSQREAGLKDAENKLAKLLEAKANIPSDEEVATKLLEAAEERKAKNAAYTAAKNEWGKLKREIETLKGDSVHLQKKVAAMNDEGKQRRNNIFREFPPLGKISQWLQNNGNLFRRPVVGPIACEITPKSPDAAAFVEQHVPNQVLKAFVVETKHDQDLLYQKVRVELKLPINIILLHRTELTRPYSDRKLAVLKKEHGVVGYLDDMFEAPETVMQVLRSSAMVEKVLVGSKKTHDCMSRSGLLSFLSEPDVALHQTGTQAFVIVVPTGRPVSLKFNGIKSRYADGIATRQDDIKPAKLLTAGINPVEKQNAENRLRDLHDQLNTTRSKLEEAEESCKKCEVEAQTATAKNQVAKKHKDDVQKMRTKCELAEKRVAEAQKEMETDDDEEKKESAKKLMNRVVQCVNALEAHSEANQNLVELRMETASAVANKSAVTLAERVAQMAYVEKKNTLRHVEVEAKRVQSEYARAKDEVKKKKKEADLVAPLTEELRAQLNSLSVSNLHELEVALADALETANAIDANPDVVRQYEERKLEIESLEGQIEDHAQSTESQKSNIAAKRTRWESSLGAHVEEINELFSKYFADMGCSGEVVLWKGEEEGEGPVERQLGNFKDWGIQIRVSFRENVKAEVLSAHRNSGGERSVSTIMYLMAMQHLMVSPFRCVDEINQGLDEVNERAVFRRIVENSCRKPEGGPMNHSGQYFLITPKLLPNLVDMEEDAVTLQFVFNGPYNFAKPSAWNTWLSEMAGGRKRAAVEHLEDDDENNKNNRGVSRGKKGRRSD